MSVDVRAHIGLGWVIPQSLYCEMRRCAGDKWGEVEDEFHYVNAYRSDSDVFFGTFLTTVDEGEYEDLVKRISDLYAELDEEVYCNKYAHIMEVCGQEPTPDSMWAEARIYLINRVS